MLGRNRADDIRQKCPVGIIKTSAKLRTNCACVAMHLQFEFVSSAEKIVPSIAWPNFVVRNGDEVTAVDLGIPPVQGTSAQQLHVILKPECPTNHKLPPLSCIRSCITSGAVRAEFANSVSAPVIQSDTKPDSNKAATIDAVKRRVGASRILSKRRANRMAVAGMSGSTLRALMVQFKNAVNTNVPRTHNARNSEAASRSCQ